MGKNEKTILIAAGFVLFLSLLEILAVISEIHGHLYKIKKRELIEIWLMKIANKLEKPQ